MPTLRTGDGAGQFDCLRLHVLLLRSKENIVLAASSSHSGDDAANKNEKVAKPRTINVERRFVAQLPVWLCGAGLGRGVSVRDSKFKGTRDNDHLMGVSSGQRMPPLALHT